MGYSREIVSVRFDVKQVIGIGRYSVVYEAVPVKEDNGNNSYALKRFFLQNPSAVICALREHRILVRLATRACQSPFLSTLLCSYRIHGCPILILGKGSGFDLFDLLSQYGPLKESDARFYTSEVICGLEYLHDMQIVHLDLKPENVLISHSGHVLITDFDRSYDITRDVGTPKSDDFCGTPLFMAPEVAAEVEITTKADVWGLAILMAEIVFGPVRGVTGDFRKDIKRAKAGQWKIKNFHKLSKALRAFFNACLKLNPKERPYIYGVKRLRFYKYVNWDDVVSLRTEPPRYLSQLRYSSRNNSVDPNNSVFLQAAFGKNTPSYSCRFDGTPRVIVVSPNDHLFARAGLTSERLEELFADFDFVHPNYTSDLSRVSVGNSSLAADVDKSPRTPGKRS